MSTDAPHQQRDQSPAERLVSELASHLAQVMAQAAPLGLCWECAVDIRTSPVVHAKHCEWGRLLNRGAAFHDHSRELAMALRWLTRYRRPTARDWENGAAQDEWDRMQRQGKEALAAYDADDAATKGGAK